MATGFITQTIMGFLFYSNWWRLNNNNSSFAIEYLETTLGAINYLSGTARSSGSSSTALIGRRDGDWSMVGGSRISRTPGGLADRPRCGMRVRWLGAFRTLLHRGRTLCVLYANARRLSRLIKADAAAARRVQGWTNTARELVLDGVERNLLSKSELVLRLLFVIILQETVLKNEKSNIYSLAEFYTRNNCSYFKVRWLMVDGCDCKRMGGERRLKNLS